MKANLEYVELFARAIRTDNSLFKQQKMLIESQLHSSTSFFRNNFDYGSFEKEAREYLMKIGLL